MAKHSAHFYVIRTAPAPPKYALQKFYAKNCINTNKKLYVKKRSPG